VGSENYGFAWAREVAARGWPRKDAPVAEKVEMYEDLAGAYQILAEQAADNGDMDRYESCSELVEHADRLARQCRGPEHRW
jgi:hypothetical protein